MSIGENVGYTTDEIRRGGNLAAAAGDAADELAFRVARVVLDAAGFGGPDQAGRLADEMAAFRDHMAGLARRVEARHTDLALRAAAVAAEGDQLVAVTTGLAAAVPAGGS